MDVIGIVSGRDVAFIPWGALMRDINGYVHPDSIPANINFTEPSKMTKADLVKLHRHLLHRQADTEVDHPFHFLATSSKDGPVPCAKVTSDRERGRVSVIALGGKTPVVTEGSEDGNDDEPVTERPSEDRPRPETPKGKKGKYPRPSEPESESSNDDDDDDTGLPDIHSFLDVEESETGSVQGENNARSPSPGPTDDDQELLIPLSKVGPPTKPKKMRPKPRKIVQQESAAPSIAVPPSDAEEPDNEPQVRTPRRRKGKQVMEVVVPLTPRSGRSRKRVMSRPSEVAKEKRTRREPQTPKSKAKTKEVEGVTTRSGGRRKTKV